MFGGSSCLILPLLQLMTALVNASLLASTIERGDPRFAAHIATTLTHGEPQ
jgi:hypothetical protein